MNWKTPIFFFSIRTLYFAAEMKKRMLTMLKPRSCKPMQTRHSVADAGVQSEITDAGWWACILKVSRWCTNGGGVGTGGEGGVFRFNGVTEIEVIT